MDKALLVVLALIATVLTVAPAHARSHTTFEERATARQEHVIALGTEQSLSSIDAARALCANLGRTFDPNKVRVRTGSNTRSRIEHRRRYYGRRNTIYLDLNRVLFGQPRLPQDYRNDTYINVDVSNPCKSQ